jgi:hypothetical protein
MLIRYSQRKQKVKDRGYIFSFRTQEDLGRRFLCLKRLGLWNALLATPVTVTAFFVMEMGK